MSVQSTFQNMSSAASTRSGLDLSSVCIYTWMFVCMYTRMYLFNFGGMERDGLALDTLLATFNSLLLIHNREKVCFPLAHPSRIAAILQFLPVPPPTQKLRFSKCRICPVSALLPPTVRCPGSRQHSTVNRQHEISHYFGPRF